MEEFIKQHLDYEVKLSSFEGPLDLLLHLIKDAKIDIKDIFISEVTEQFLSYMNQLEEIDMDSASEFLEMAATLLEIKSKSLLPKIEPDDPEEEDDESRLIRQLEEYKLFKEAGQKLKQQETVDIFFKEPDNKAFSPQVVLKDMNLEGLLDAFSKLLVRLENEEKERNSPKEIRKDNLTVAQQMEHIKDKVLEEKSTTFFSMFEEDFGKLEVITTFQAILELLKMQIVCVVQKNHFEDIYINLKDGAEEILKKPLQIDTEEME